MTKLLPRAHIGYLVGYDSTNIFQVWVPVKGIVISSRNVTFDESLLFNSAGPHADELLKGQLEEVIETIAISPHNEKMSSPTYLDNLLEDTDPSNSFDPSDFPETEENTQSLDLIFAQSEKNFTHEQSDSTPALMTPDPTPEPRTPILTNEDISNEPESATSDTIQIHTMPEVIPGPSRHGDITTHLDENNILGDRNARSTRSSSRRQAYLTDLCYAGDLPGLQGAFTAGINHRQIRVHRDDLPLPPRHWKDLQGHTHRKGFYSAAQKEYQDLQRRGTFRIEVKTPETKTLPLL